MRVGVIVPVHGWAPYLAEALDSVLAEGPDEVVVVDDASPEPVRVDAPCAVVRREIRGGPAAARETGLEALRTCELIALCDADDAWRPGRLCAQREALGDADVAVGRAEVVGPDNRRTGERWEDIPAGSFTPPYDRNPICTSSVLVRRAALEAAGGFVGPPPAAPAAAPPGSPAASSAAAAAALPAVPAAPLAAPAAAPLAAPLHRAEDHDLWLRLAATGASFVSVPSAVVAYRRRAGALTADVAALARAQIEVHARHAAGVGEEERRRVEAADLRALAAGLTRERRWAEARAALRAIPSRRGADSARLALLSVPLARGAMGRRDPYRR